MLRVLVVDDHPVMAEIVRAYLALFADQFQVVGTARDGRRAVELGLTLAPDVVLMDVRMPIMDGLEATRRLRRAGVTAVIITHSSFGHDLLGNMARAAGASLHLQNPFSLDELRRAMLDLHGQTVRTRMQTS